MKLIKELTIEEIRTLYKNNKQFSDVVYTLAYDTSMVMLDDWLDDSGISEAFDIDCTSYATYITRPYAHGVREGIAVADKLDTEYLSEEEKKLYDQICELADVYNNTTYEEQEKWEKEHGVDIREKADELCDELCELLTKDVKGYDDVTDEMIEQILVDILDGCTSLSDWEVAEDGVIYERIVREYR